MRSNIFEQLRNVYRTSRNFTTKSSSGSTGPIPPPKTYTFQRHQKNNDDRVTPYGWIMLAIPVTTFGLGCWQVQRKKWKEQLIQQLHVQTNSPPVDLPEDLSDLDSMEYRPVRVKGKFLHNRELIMGPRSLITPDDEHKGGLFTQQDTSIGYLVVTPFKLEDSNKIVLINRGWVPRNFVNPNSRLQGQSEETMEIVGVVRKPENRPQFTPKQSGEIFMYRDVPLMCSITGADPVFLDAKTSVQGGPIGGQTRVTLRNEHVSYIVTWFSLSALTSLLWYRQIFRRINR